MRIGDTVRVGVAGAAIAVLASPTAAQEVSSQYSTIEWNSECSVLDRSAADEPGAWARLECAGYGTNKVLVADDDGRMSLDYGLMDTMGPWESFAGFNQVIDTVEWRLADGQAFATIHRWLVSGGGQERQVLVVSTVAASPDGQSCMVGFVDAGAAPEANTLAREVADRQARTFRCGESDAGWYGAVEEPAPRPVLVVADDGGQAEDPEAMLRQYWSALSVGGSVSRFLMDGDDGPVGLASEYEIGRVEPLVAADAERRVRVTLKLRSGTGESLSAKVGLVRLEGTWRIASAQWP
ncbi:hypothetical protein [Halomonas daqiaonensis]|uniref:Uncharacterized protein n=1 Tax=Halomonas daqiaonensis TaxID=650850 RepID=A0A1H7KZ61_9GAMM|nr:hypothetical protein [Halomonas daqiaonensis]SEK91395.1 hypothetical protein SAMN04488129_105118 [Halomonas daqiaonensis]